MKRIALALVAMLTLGLGGLFASDASAQWGRRGGVSVNVGGWGGYHRAHRHHHHHHHHGHHHHHHRSYWYGHRPHYHRSYYYGYYPHTYYYGRPGVYLRF